MMKTVSKTKVRLNLTQQARARVALTMLICLAFGDAYALPYGEQVQAGNVAFERGAQFLNINQASQKAIVNWQSFSIATNEAVRLNQPTQGVALFRVVGADSSQIFGSLTATGSLFLSNPNGVLFGRSAQVDVGSLVATSMRIDNDEFLAGRYQFNADGNGNVVNDGIIRTEDGGYIALLGSTVENNGSLQANNGSVVLGSAQSAILDVYGDGLVRVKLYGDALDAVVKQTGNITADGGAVQLATHARSAAINVDGVVQANSLVNRNGVIRLEGNNNARVSVNGSLNANGETAGSQGGQIEVTGEQVALFKNANLNAYGNAGGGTILVGGDLQGKNADVYNSRTTFVDKDAKINVDAIQNGDGGKAIVWANNTTRFYGNISSKGGMLAGNGGFIEVSGKENLDFLGKVDLSASNGVGGRFLLDPTNIILNTTTQANPTNNPNGTPDIAFGDAATNIPVAGTTTVQIADIVGFSEALFQATNDITIASTLTMGINNNIRLEAGNNINVNAALTTSGLGNINLRADADNSGVGNLAIAGNITSRQGGITLSAATITRSAGNIASTGAVGANAGNINMSATGAITLGAATISANSVTAATAGNAGNINISAGTDFTGTGAINTTGGNSTGANTAGGSGGSVSIVSTSGAIATGTITTSGGAAGASVANGSNAGNVTVTASAGNATVGAITARTGSATGTGSSGGAASVNISGAAVTLAAVNTSGQNNGNGGTITANASGVLTLNGAVNSSGGTAIIGNAGKNAGLINLAGGSVASAAAGTITASGSNGLGANQAGGNGAAVNINSTGAISVRAITANGGNGVAINAAGGNAGSISIATNTGNITTNAGALTARTGAGLGTGANSTQGFITVNNTSAAGTIATGTINTSGQTNGHGGNVTLSSLGTTTVGTIATSGAASTGIRAGRTAGNVTVSGAAVTTGAITANGANGVGLNQAGGNAGAVSLTASTGEVVTQAISAIGGAGVATNANGGNGGAVVLDAGTGSTITMNNINTTGGNRAGTGTAGNGGNISVAENALLSANSVITATGGTVGGTSGPVNFAGTINSIGANRTLAINTTAATTLAGAIGNSLALASLTTNAGGTTTINSGEVTTTGAQAYGDVTTLGAASTFTSTNSNFTFGSSINAGGNNVVIAAGSGVVTANNAANNFANLAITAGSANIRDANAIVLGATNVTGAYTLQTAGAITQTAGATVGGATTLNAGATNDITLSNAANNFNTVAVTSGRDVNVVDANALTINASTVRTMTARTLSNNLTLGGAIAASATTGTAINFVSAANFLNPGNNTMTTGVGSRWLVYSTSPLLDTRGANLLAAFDFKQYNTAFGGSILGIGDGFIYTLAPIVTPTLTGSAIKGYDGNTTAPISSLVLGSTGAIDGDNVVLAGLGSATYDDRNAGTGKIVSASGISLTSAANGAKLVFGYQLASTTATGAVGTINQRAITVTAATDTKIYDASTSSAGLPTLTSGSIVGGDSATFSQTFDNKNAGTGKTLTAAGTVADGNGGGNYAVTFVADNTGVINPLAITGNITVDNKIYDTTNAANIATRTLTGVLGTDDVTYTGGSATFNNKNAGTGKTVTGSGLGLSGVDAGNYMVNTSATTTADIARADISAVIGITADNKVYDATTGATLNTGAAGFVGIIGLDDLNVATANGNFTDVNAGAGKTVNITGIGLGGTDAGNYNLVTTTATTTADISQRAITVTANPGQSKVFGAADPLPLSFSVGGLGLVGGDTFTGALNRAAGETVGSYAINQGSLAASSNYVLSYVGSIFNIFAPSSTTSGSNPRNAAGLVDLNPSLTNYTNPQLFVLNVGATAAGADSEGSTACEQDPETLAKDKDFVLMLNYGLNLPRGLNTSCDTTKI